MNFNPTLTTLLWQGYEVTDSKTMVKMHCIKRQKIRTLIVKTGIGIILSEHVVETKPVLKEVLRLVKKEIKQHNKKR